MSIIKFMTDDQFDTFFRKYENCWMIGEGGVGNCYDGKDGYCYKKYWFVEESVATDKILTQENYSSDTFLFPIDVYSVDNTVYGYKTKYIKGNKFKGNDFEKENLFPIDGNEDILYNAMLEFIKELIDLSNSRILVYDMPYNIIFDGKKLYAIDTDKYKYKNESSIEDITKKNIYAFICAIKAEYENELTEKMKDYISNLMNIYAIDITSPVRKRC